MVLHCPSFKMFCSRFCIKPSIPTTYLPARLQPTESLPITNQTTNQTPGSFKMSSFGTFITIKNDLPSELFNGTSNIVQGKLVGKLPVTVASDSATSQIQVDSENGNSAILLEAKHLRLFANVFLAKKVMMDPQEALRTMLSSAATPDKLVSISFATTLFRIV